MSLVFVIASLLAAAFFVFALTGPLLGRGRAATPVDQDADLDQRLFEIDADEASDFLSASSADESRIEAKRAALQQRAATGQQVSEKPSAGGSTSRLVLLGIAALAPVAAAAIYLQVGSPGYEFGASGGPPPPNAGQAEIDLATLPPEERRAAIEGMVDGLEGRLVTNPGDAKGWRMLARSKAVFGESAEALAAYRQLFALGAGEVDDWKAFAEILAAEAPAETFPIDPEFINALDQIDIRSPNDPFVAFYRGGAAFSGGDPARAAELWRGLLETLPAEAPIMDILRRLIADAETKAQSAGTQSGKTQPEGAESTDPSPDN